MQTEGDVGLCDLDIGSSHYIRPDTSLSHTLPRPDLYMQDANKQTRFNSTLCLIIIQPPTPLKIQFIITLI